jgi:hypothetical protein
MRSQQLSEPAVTDRQGIGFGWLQNAWLLHARLKIHRGGIDTRSVASTVVLPCNENPKQPGCERRNSVSSTAAEDSRDEVACPPYTQMHAWHVSLVARSSIGLANQVRLLTAEKLQ